MFLIFPEGLHLNLPLTMCRPSGLENNGLELGYFCARASLGLTCIALWYVVTMNRQVHDRVLELTRMSLWHGAIMIRGGASCMISTEMTELTL